MAKILIVSRTYAPNIGGLEKIMQGLAQGFAAKGHSVEVITETPSGPSYEDKLIEVHRKISFFKKLQLYSRADRILEANISLNSCLLGILFYYKWWVVHHIHYHHGRGWLSILKNYVTLLSNNIAVSEFIKRTLKASSVVIPNFYSDEFRIIPNGIRDRDFIFVGRLVSDKGVDVLLKACSLIKVHYPDFSLTVVGDGPERNALQGLAKELGLEPNVFFAGTMTGHELVKEYNRHRIQVIPSTWLEPFGIVALEGMACGCRVISSDTGGLPEAIGTAGVIFKAGHSAELATIMLKEYANIDVVDGEKVISHLSKFTKEKIVNSYLQQLF